MPHHYIISLSITKRSVIALDYRLHSSRFSISRYSIKPLLNFDKKNRNFFRHAFLTHIHHETIIVTFVTYTQPNHRDAISFLCVSL